MSGGGGGLHDDGSQPSSQPRATVHFNLRALARLHHKFHHRFKKQSQFTVTNVWMAM